jgi:hypothetical protein
MLDEFGGLIDGINNIINSSNFSYECIVLLVSCSFFSGIGLFIGGDVSNCYSDVFFRNSQSFNGVVSQLSIGCDLIVVI